MCITQYDWHHKKWEVCTNRSSPNNPMCWWIRSSLRCVAVHSLCLFKITCFQRQHFHHTVGCTFKNSVEIKWMVNDPMPLSKTWGRDNARWHQDVNFYCCAEWLHLDSLAERIVTFARPRGWQPSARIQPTTHPKTSAPLQFTTNPITTLSTGTGQEGRRKGAKRGLAGVRLWQECEANWLSQMPGRGILQKEEPKCHFVGHIGKEMRKKHCSVTRFVRNKTSIHAHEQKLSALDAPDRLNDFLLSKKHKSCVRIYRHKEKQYMWYKFAIKDVVKTALTSTALIIASSKRFLHFVRNSWIVVALNDVKTEKRIDWNTIRRVSTKGSNSQEMMAQFFNSEQHWRKFVA